MKTRRVQDALEVLSREFDERRAPLMLVELADQLGRPADALYYHVKTLLGVGLLIEAGTAGEGRSEGAVYRLPGDHNQHAFDLFSFGPDGQEGGESLNADIVNWDVGPDE